MHNPARSFLALLIVLAPAIALAQPPADQPDLPLTPALRSQVIEALITHVRKTYVFPEVAKRIEAALRKKSYAQITSAKELEKVLTADLQAVSKDKHLKIGYSHEPLPERKPDAKPSPEAALSRERRAAKWNYGFAKVERLAGNIGYVELRQFESPALAGDVAASVFRFLAGTDALIIDLRRNTGGEPGMVALLVSYLLPAGEDIHISDIYMRPTNETQQFWALPHLPAPRYAKDVYVLTANRTFSAAEAFAYDVQSLKRGKVIGEVTRGGAHPGEFARIHKNFAAFVPSGRAINAVTKTNWEGVGVKPDVAVPAATALDVAYQHALTKLPKALGPGLQDEIDEALRALKKPKP